MRTNTRANDYTHELHNQILTVEDFQQVLPLSDVEFNNNSQCESHISYHETSRYSSKHLKYYRYKLGLKTVLRTLKRVGRVRNIHETAPVSKHPPSFVLACDNNENEDPANVMLRQALRLLLENELGILQVPDIPTLIDFISFIEKNSSALSKKIRRQCRIIEQTNGSNHKGKVKNGEQSLVRPIMPETGCHGVYYLQEREVVIRDALSKGPVGLTSHLWPALRLVSVLTWDPAHAKDYERLCRTWCYGVGVGVSLWLPGAVHEGLWGQACERCRPFGIIGTPTFSLHADGVLLEYLSLIETPFPQVYLSDEVSDIILRVCL